MDEHGKTYALVVCEGVGCGRACAAVACLCGEMHMRGSAMCVTFLCVRWWCAVSAPWCSHHKTRVCKSARSSGDGLGWWPEWLGVRCPRTALPSALITRLWLGL